MSKQLDRVHLVISSPAEIERTAQQLTAIREGFLDTGNFGRYAPRRLILESWQRCDRFQVNPGRRWAPLALSRDAQLDARREANEPLVRAARPVIDRLTDFLADSGYVIVLSDADGCLLEVLGDQAIRRRLARIDFIPGGDWSEAAAGTNAIGTALATNHVVQLMAAEHYCDGWQDLTCTAAPIRHPFTGEVIGILDATGDYRLIRSFLSGFLATAAMEIQQNMAALIGNPYAGTRPATIRFATIDLPTAPWRPDIRANEIDGPLQPHWDSESVWEIPQGAAIQLQFELQEQRARDAERLAIAAGIISASLDVRLTLEQTAEQVAQLLGIESSAVCLFDEAGEMDAFHISPRQNAAHRETMRALEVLLRHTEQVALIREPGEPVLVNDVRTSTLPSAGLIEQIGIRSIALLPLVTARGVTGFIVAPRPTPHQWIVDEVQRGLTLAAQAATAIENARLFATLQQHNRHIEALNAMSQLLSKMVDPGQYLDLLLVRIIEIMDLDAGIILLPDQDTSDLAPTARCGRQVKILDNLCERASNLLAELAEQVVARRVPLLTRRVECRKPSMAEPQRAMASCDFMAMPLVVNSSVLGALVVGKQCAPGITEEDFRLFAAIGQQIDLALKNAQFMRSASEMDALREADRLKSEFLAAVSHDLRSPLTAIRTSVESLLDSGGEQSALEQEHLLHNIAGQASGLGRLVDHLLDFSRIEAGKLSLDCDWTELPALIADTITKFDELHQGLRVERDLPANMPICYTDPDRLTQVLWNLLENAYKYAPPHSPISVAARRCGAEAQICVADRGPGIPADEHEKIFQRFYRLNRDQRTRAQGSGLGLAICRGIVEAHGGRIWVEDRLGGGSVFRIALPLPSEELELGGDSTKAR
jgi:two-component system sensor histidine kinase KdpD